jgi:L-amino acid N-acyltransferase YncA
MSARIAAISSRYPYFVYEVEGKVVGYSYAHAWKERAAYRNTLETTVYVSPDFMRRGVGKALMIKLIDACRADGFQVLIACITEGNAGSIALHKLLGFKQVSHFERVGTKFDRRLDVSDFELILS